ncbi:MAG: hypothetical protein AB1659_12420 [Thermodesulfobacteriota bacterium]
MRKKAPILFIRILLIFPLVLCILTGCGKKGPPVPPGAKPVPPIADLRVTLGNNRIWLSWSIPDDVKKMKTEIKGFSIYRSKTSSSEPECTDCPAAYKRIAQIPHVSQTKISGTEVPISYEDRVEPGNRYIYTVSLILEDGRESPASNPVQFSY